VPVPFRIFPDFVPFFSYVLYLFIRHIIAFSFLPLSFLVSFFLPYLILLYIFSFWKPFSLKSSLLPFHLIRKGGHRMRSLLLLSESTGHFQELVSYSCMCHLVFTYRTFHKSIFVFMQPWNTTIRTIHTISKSH
jgi:hypothetical protein